MLDLERERNDRAFDKEFKPINILMENMKSEAKRWEMATLKGVVIPVIARFIPFSFYRHQ
jgi:hypothetical protein